jgi:starch synthase
VADIQNNASRFSGILNGLDEGFNPGRLYERRWIPQAFDSGDLSGKVDCHLQLQEQLKLPKDPDIPILLWSQRLVHGKGVEDFSGGAVNLIYKLPIQVVIFGRGDSAIEQMMELKAGRFPDKIRFVRFSQFNSVFEPSFIAGSDIVVMPSLEEPCGLLALKAMRLGTLPLVRPVGGLGQMIRDGENGFVIQDGESLAAEIGKKLTAAVTMFRDEPARWRLMQQNALAYDSTWAVPAEKYVRIYHAMVASQS